MLKKPDIPQLSFKSLRLKPRENRAHKVSISLLGKPTEAGASFVEWFAAMPGFLGANELRSTVDAVVAARQAGKPVVFAFGGHIVKTGCSPLVIDLMQRGVITAIATNGSGAIHDLELAETGQTSEEVADTIRDGSFGMVIETCAQMIEAARRGATGVGLGRGVGEVIRAASAPHAAQSLFAEAARLDLPATVHVALGTDTVHMHPEANGNEIGTASMIDFRTLCGVVAAMDSQADEPGGVWLNFGSAVIMPEVFLKAVSVARNLGFPLRRLQTANFDMLRHYRPTQNVITRPVEKGMGHQVTGHH
ncbi:MAG: hypothetical protein AB7N71_05225, partial [Phycisphaerae bacterium]